MRSKKGFTLIELVVVMAIIAVLAVLVVGAIVAARNTAKETAHRANAKTIETGFEAWYAKNRSYPTTISANTIAGAASTLGVTIQTTGVCSDATYNGGGIVTVSSTAGQPAYTITPALASCGGAQGAPNIITGPNN